AEPHALHDAGAKIVHDRIGAIDEAAQQRLLLRIPQIEHDAALVAVEAAIDRVLQTRRVGIRRAREIAGAGTLDLDDVGAVVAEHLRGARPHHHLGEIDDPDAFERQRHAAFSSIVALAEGTSPGSPPCARTSFWICRASTWRTVVPPLNASVAAMPAASPIAMQGGISREIFCAAEVAE